MDRDGFYVEKTYGLVVDYWGVSRDLEAALASFEKDEAKRTWQPVPADPAHRIDAAAGQAEWYFRSRGANLDDPWLCIRIFDADASSEGEFKADLFEEFSESYRTFARLLDQFLPDPRALPYVPRLARLTAIRNFVRAQYLREDASVDWQDISTKVRHLVDSRIDAEVRELMKPVSILDQDFEEKIGGLPHDEARASLMEHAVRAQISERLAENPAFYERLSERLRKIIDDMRRRLIDAAEAVRRLRQLRQDVLGIAGAARQHGFSEVSFAVYELLERAAGNGTPSTDAGVNGAASHGHAIGESREMYGAGLDEGLKSVATTIERTIIQGQAIVDWQNKEDVLRVMRRDVKRELRKIGDLTEQQINELAASIVEVARHRSSP